MTVYVHILWTSIRVHFALSASFSPHMVALCQANCSPYSNVIDLCGFEAFYQLGWLPTYLIKPFDLCLSRLCAFCAETFFSFECLRFGSVAGSVDRTCLASLLQLFLSLSQLRSGQCFFL
ncbi:hypothetical protein KSP39_PZI022301 [Platanthera zijinensis]|uniref:Secreted protein n=1 Tax=Platanthera zijinensis TaxID=2320716 RepID=A0AAP0FU51_9ASPA